MNQLGNQFFVARLLAKVFLTITLTSLFSWRTVFAKDSFKDVLNGKVLRASGFQYPPILMMKKLANGSFSYEGFSMEALDLISEYFNLTFRFVQVDPREVTKHDIFYALYNQLEKGEVDIAPFTFETSLETLKHVSFNHPMWVSEFTMLQPWPREESRLSSPIKPFTLTVWVSFLGSCVALMFLLTALAYLQDRVAALSNLKVKASRGDNNKESLAQPLSEIMYKQFEYILTIIASQGNSIRYSSRTSLRIVIAAWLLSMVVLVYAYTGVFTAIMAVPKLEPIVNTLDELASSKRFRVTKEKHTVLTTQFLEATEGTYKMLGDQLRKDSSLLFGDMFQMIDNVVKRDCIFPAPILFNNFLLKEDTKANAKCRMTTSKPLSLYVALQLGMPKGSPYAKIIDESFSLMD